MEYIPVAREVRKRHVPVPPLVFRGRSSCPWARHGPAFRRRAETSHGGDHGELAQHGPGMRGAAAVAKYPRATGIPRTCLGAMVQGGRTASRPTGSVRERSGDPARPRSHRGDPALRPGGSLSIPGAFHGEVGPTRPFNIQSAWGRVRPQGAGFGCCRWMASMASMTSGGSRRSAAPRSSSSCSRVVAPMMLAVTKGRLVT